LPVSGSTSTSQNCIEKPGAIPPASTEAAAVIGPPVSAFFAANSLKDNGTKSPTLLLAGLTWLPAPINPDLDAAKTEAHSSLRGFGARITRHEIVNALCAFSRDRDNGRNGKNSSGGLLTRPLDLGRQRMPAIARFV
jgi:hypothetical protein